MDWLYRKETQRLKRYTMVAIRVLHNIASLHFGGSQAFVMSIYQNLDRTKVQFDFVVAPEERKGLYDQVEKLGGRVFVCPQYVGTNHFAYCKWWNDFFLEHPEFHVIHGHVRSTAAIYLSIAKKHGLVTIAHSHSTSNGKGFDALVKDTMQLPIRYIADYLFACSDKAGRWLYGKKATLQSNYKLIPNGVDLQRFAFNKDKREAIRNQLKIDKSDFVIGHIGRFTKPKNHKFLIDLFFEYHKNARNSKLLLVGDGELFDSIKQQVERLGIDEDVLMVGGKSDTETYYQAMDVFVFPSLWEGLGIVEIEAQANGLYCLVSKNIPMEAVLVESTKVLSLQNIYEWLIELNNIQVGTRNMTVSKRMQQYNIQTISKEFQEFYIEQCRCSR